MLFFPCCTRSLSMSMQRTLRLVARSFAAAALLFGLVAAVRPLAAQQPYKVLDHWKIGGDGFWDDLTADGQAHRLYLTHGPRVDVVDTQTGKLIGSDRKSTRLNSRHLGISDAVFC